MYVRGILCYNQSLLRLMLLNVDVGVLILPRHNSGLAQLAGRLVSFEFAI